MDRKRRDRISRQLKATTLPIDNLIQRSLHPAVTTVLILFVLACFAVAQEAPVTTPTPSPCETLIPSGVFDLVGFGRQVKISALTNPDVDGISVHEKWWHLEPSEGVYDWSTLDAYVARITPYGKNILIRIGTMGGRHSLGGNTPDWVMDAVGANTITYYDSGGVLRTIPLFWDQTYLDKKKAMIGAIGARYSGNPLVKVATASFANRHSEDWSVPDSTQIDGIPPAGSSEASRMLAAGYTHQKMVDAGTQIMDAAMAAWPNQVIYLAIGRIDRPLEQDPDSVARDVRDATRSRWGVNRLVIGKEIISNVMPFAPPDPTSAWELFYESGPAIAGQNLSACYGDPHCQMNGGNCNGLTADQILRGTVDHFVSYGGKWLEIYDDDVTNLLSAIHYAHQQLFISCPTPTDYVLYKGNTRQTAVWHMNNNVFLGGAYGPTLPAGWNVIDVADFNRDGNNDYVLFNSSTRQTALWYLSGVTLVGGAFGPTLPSGWALVATGDFNSDGKPDYVLYNASTRQTAIWYMNNNVYAGGAFGPALPAAWRIAGVADFNRDGKTDYLLFNASTHQTAIWYLSGVTFFRGVFGPTLPSAWALVGVADFNGDGKPDYLLYNASTRQTAIWYMNNNVFAGGAFGPTLPAGWNLVAP